jgi:serine/threonine protein kinase
MIFLVESIISKNKFIIKVFGWEKRNEFLHEMEMNAALMKDHRVVKAVKYDSNNRNKADKNGLSYHFVDQFYIFIPYCPRGTLMDLLWTVQQKGKRISKDLALYLFK